MLSESWTVLSAKAVNWLIQLIQLGFQIIESICQGSLTLPGLVCCFLIDNNQEVLRLLGLGLIKGCDDRFSFLEGKLVRVMEALN